MGTLIKEPQTGIKIEGALLGRRRTKNSAERDKRVVKENIPKRTILDMYNEILKEEFF